ncbi:MAG: anion permease [Deltaproteobacteria bacterium]|nr:anion permease [Deltaproteobacteria bacterium]
MKPHWGISHVIAAVACLTGVIIYFSPPPDGMSSEAMGAASVIVVVIGLWATAVVPEYLTSIVFFFIAVTLVGVPPEVVFSGFHSTAAWMVFGGLVIGFAVQETGLGARMAGTVSGYFKGSYFGIIVRTVTAAALLAFVMPSNMGRVMVMLPIFLGLANRLGFAEGSNGRSAITLAVGAGTLYPSLGILTAAVPNLALLGAAENIHGLRITYGRYLLMQFPVISIVSILALPVIIWVLFPDEPRQGESFGAIKPYTTHERKLLIILVLSLGFWMTDFAHGISPGWIAMGAALLCLLPGLGMIPPVSLISKINLGPWFFITGVIGMGTVLSTSGLGGFIGKHLFSIVELTPGNDLANFAALSAIGMVLGVVATVPGEPAIMTSFAENISAATGWPLTTVLMAQVTSWPMAIFPYELPPLVVAAHLGGVRIGPLIRLLLAMTILAWLVIVPLQFVWWRYLGYFG